MALFVQYILNHFFQRFSDCKDEITAVQYSQFSVVVISARSLVILPLSIVEGAAFPVYLQTLPVSDCHPVLHVYEELLSMQKSLPTGGRSFFSF